MQEKHFEQQWKTLNQDTISIKKVYICTLQSLIYEMKNSE